MEHRGKLLAWRSHRQPGDLVFLEREEVSHLELERGKEDSEMVGVWQGSALRVSEAPPS